MSKMGRKKKYESTEIVKEILSVAVAHRGDVEGSLMFKHANQKKKEDREFLSKNINKLKIICEKALKELEAE